ncbi:MAG: Gfo/Idh/MocA family protein [Planctomycetota bacterium]|jgi:predicted dehydrogenase
MNTPLRIAVVGCGYWGPNLVRNFAALPDCIVAKICDADPDRLAKLAARYPDAEPVTAFEEVVRDGSIDAVAIATPVRTHFPLARASLASGKHAFVEKPLAASAAECRELVGMAEERGLALMVGHVFLYSAAVRRLKEIVDSGEIGDVLYVSSQRLNLGLYQRDINVAWDLAPHDLSIVLYVLGRAPESVNCQGKAHVSTGVEDVTVMSLNFSGQAFATIQSSWLDPSKIRRTTVVGSRKMVVYDDIEPIEKLKIYDKRVEVPPHYDSFGSFPFSYHYGDMRAPHLRQVEPLRVECQEFLDCARTGAKSVSCGREGLKVVQILEAASRSLGRGGVEVEIDAA